MPSALEWEPGKALGPNDNLEKALDPGKNLKL